MDEYLGAHLGSQDEVLERCLEENREGELPGIDVSPMQGKFLHLLARIQGARRILEIGTLGGYSAIWLGRALPEDGRMLTLELNPKHAAVARRNLDRAGLAGKVEILVGPATESLEKLVARMEPAFDLIFIDADKTGYPEYLRWALKLARKGTVILADNVVRKGQIADAQAEDANVQGARKFIEAVGREEGLSAAVVQTVGKKGYDGFLLARVI